MEEFKHLLDNGYDNEGKENNRPKPNKMGKSDSQPELFSKKTIEHLHSILITDKIVKVGHLGRGKFANVSKGMWKQKNGFVPVVIKSPLNNSPKYRLPLNNEAKALQKISSAHVITLLGIIADPCGNGKLYFNLVLEYCQGGTLESRLKKISEGPIQYRLTIARQITKGIEAIHEAGFIHLDLKPENILFDANDVAKICDFGGAVQTTGSDNNSNSNMKPKIISTPAYSAPELLAMKGMQSLGIEIRLSNRVDIYALGIIMNQLITGQKPLKGIRRIGDLLNAVFIHEKRDHIPNKTPSGFKNIIERAWAQRATDRPSAKIVVEELDKIIDEISFKRSLLKSV